MISVNKLANWDQIFPNFSGKNSIGGTKDQLPDSVLFLSGVKFIEERGKSRVGGSAPLPWTQPLAVIGSVGWTSIPPSRRDGSIGILYYA